MTRPAITGSVISGTLRSEDLLPAFIDALEQIAPDAPITARLRDDVNRIDAQDDADQDREEVYEVLVSLMDTLDEFLPDGWYFGTLEGDGSDYGVWEVDEDDC